MGREQWIQATDWLVFDLGGVLFDFHGPAGVAELTGLEPGAAYKALVTSPAVLAFETGEIEAEVFASRFAAELGLALSTSEMLEAWASWEAGPKPGALDLIGELSSRHRTACLTNNNPIHWGRLSNLYGAHEMFERCYLSHEIGLHKPDPRLFSHVMDDLGAPAARLIYFDDRQDIIDAALKYGFNAHRVDSPTEVRAVLEAN